MISWKDYWNRSIEVFIQFDLAKKAMKSFRDTPEAVSNYATEEIEKIKKDVLDHFGEKGKIPKESWLYDSNKVSKYIKDTMESLPTKLEAVENRLNQNHLILQITLFESFMKDLHRELLQQNPSFLNPERKISLGRVVSLGLDHVINEEIEREVQSLDRKSIEDRCKYFQERLSIDWSFAGTMIPVIKLITDKRNKLLHEDPDINVDQDDLTFASFACIGITMVSTIQAHLAYPEAFILPEHSENTLQLFSKKKREPNK